MAAESTVDPVAIVTGAGSGIGRAIAVRLAVLGWRVALVGRRERALDDTARAIAARIDRPVDFMSIPIDIASEDAAEAIIDVVAGAWGRLDALVNNAGAGALCPIADTTEKLLRETFAVNTYAPAMLITKAWPLLARQPKRRGAPPPCVVNVSSMAATDPFPGLMVYAASKSAMESLARSIVNEAGTKGVRAFTIAPGAVETPLLRSMFPAKVVPPERALDPDEIAMVAVACIRGEREEDVGQVIRVVRGEAKRTSDSRARKRRSSARRRPA